PSVPANSAPSNCVVATSPLTVPVLISRVDVMKDSGRVEKLVVSPAARCVGHRYCADTPTCSSAPSSMIGAQVTRALAPPPSPVWLVVLLYSCSPKPIAAAVQ